MSHPFRTLVGCAALAAGMWMISATALADAPDVSKDSYKKAADADLKFLQERVADLAKKSPADVKEGMSKPAVGIALVLSVYGDALGDAALKADAIKVAEALVKKDFKGADALAKKLSVNPGTPGKPGALPKPFKDELMLDVVMNPFRGSTGGGLNIQNDLRDMTKSKDATKIDPAAVEILGVRSAVINAYGFHLPNDKAKVNAANQKLWEDLSTKSIDLSKQITVEAAKGKTADEKKLKTLLTNLNARCTDCHNKFRDGD